MNKQQIEIENFKKAANELEEVLKKLDEKSKLDLSFDKQFADILGNYQ
ncbi:MAG: hypothetical protein AAB373_03160 [Patescibacteria group bacterium]